MKIWQELYRYREMIFSLVRRDLKGRYKGSALGFLWTFLNPLLQLLIYTFVFSIVMRNDVKDYYLFLFVALVPWIFFSSCVAGGASCIWSQKEMVKKIYFPREVLPISFVLSQFVNMCLCFLVIFGVLIFSGRGIDLIAILYLPVVLVVEFLLALGITMITSACTVYFRDLEYILSIITMGWQFLTPVMYSVEIVPKKIQFIFYTNPMTSIIEAYRDILYIGKIPRLSSLGIAFLIGSFLFLFGTMVFEKLQMRFAEEL